MQYANPLATANRGRGKREHRTQMRALKAMHHLVRSKRGHFWRSRIDTRRELASLWRAINDGLGRDLSPTMGFLLKLLPNTSKGRYRTSDRLLMAHSNLSPYNLPAALSLQTKNTALWQILS